MVRWKNLIDGLHVEEREREASKIIQISGLSNMVSGVPTHGMGKISGK